MTTLIHKFQCSIIFIAIPFLVLALSWPQVSLGARNIRDTMVLGRDTKIVEGKNQREACSRAYAAACASVRDIAKNKNVQSECQNLCETECAKNENNRICASPSAGELQEKRESCGPTQDSPPNYRATCAITAPCRYDCVASREQLFQPIPQSTFLQRLFGIRSQPQAADVELERPGWQPLFTRNIPGAARNPPIFINESENPQNINVEVHDLKTSKVTYRGSASVPSKSKRLVRISDFLEQDLNMLVLYRIDSVLENVGFEEPKKWPNVLIDLSENKTAKVSISIKIKGENLRLNEKIVESVEITETLNKDKNGWWLNSFDYTVDNGLYISVHDEITSRREEASAFVNTLFGGVLLFFKGFAPSPAEEPEGPSVGSGGEPPLPPQPGEPFLEQDACQERNRRWTAQATGSNLVMWCHNQDQCRAVLNDCGINAGIRHSRDCVLGVSQPIHNGPWVKCE